MQQTITTLQPLQGPRLTARQRFIVLFSSCCMHCHVEYDPRTAYLDENGKTKTAGPFTRTTPVTTALLEKHLDGITGLGLSPVLDDGTVLWAAFDLDRVDYETVVRLAKRIEDMKLPVVPCLSKSIGLHGFVFFEQRTPREQAYSVLRTICHRLGLDDVEIFPRGDYTFTIHIPYLGYSSNIMHPQVAVRSNGGQDALLAFVRAAEKLKLSPEQVALLQQEAPVLRSPRVKEDTPAPIVYGPMATEIAELMWRDAANGKGTYTDAQIYGEDHHLLKVMCALEAIPAGGPAMPYKNADCNWFKLVCAIVDNLDELYGEDAVNKLIFDWACRSPYQRHWDWGDNLECNNRARKRKKKATIGLCTVYGFANEFEKQAMVLGKKEKWMRVYFEMLEGTKR